MESKYLIGDIMDNKNKIVALGGGTGLSTMLRGLKHHTSSITAIVTMSDNGGGSGVLREEMNMLPPGDIRNCLLALSNAEPLMEKIFHYRFKEGSLDGQSFGNIFLAVMNEVTGCFEKAIEKTSQVLAITGQVLPVTLDDVQLCAILQDNTVIKGETQLVKQSKDYSNPIKSVYLTPAPVKPYNKVIDEILEAKLIILSPGSLYTSIIPNLLVEGVVEAIKKSEAKVIYISNIMTQPGETEKLTLQQHIEIINKYMGDEVIDYVIANNERIPQYILDRYIDDHSEPVQIDVKGKVKLIQDSLVKIKSGQLYIRHDEEKLAQIIMDLLDCKLLMD